MLIRLVLMGCPLVRADYVGTCHSDRPPGCNSRRNDDVGRAETVGVSAPPDLSPAGDAPICCRSMQVQNPPSESPATGFIFDYCASSISCRSISEPLHTFKMHLFISIQHNRVHSNLNKLQFARSLERLFDATPSASTEIFFSCVCSRSRRWRTFIFSFCQSLIRKYWSLACISKRRHVWLKFCCKIIFTGSDNPRRRGQDVGHELSSLHRLLEGVELPSRPR